MKEEAQTRWEPLNKLWDMGLPVALLMKVSGSHTSVSSFCAHVAYLRKQWGEGWFKPRPRGFKPITDISSLIKKEE